jgi:hypothetical protein
MHVAALFASTYWPLQKSAPDGVVHAAVQPPDAETEHIAWQLTFTSTVHDALQLAWQLA